MEKHAHLFSQAVQSLLLLGLTATLCFAQGSHFGQVAQGVSVEVVAIVKWVGVIIAVVVGLSLRGAMTVPLSLNLRSSAALRQAPKIKTAGLVLRTPRRPSDCRPVERPNALFGLSSSLGSYPRSPMRRSARASQLFGWPGYWTVDCSISHRRSISRSNLLNLSHISAAQALSLLALTTVGAFAQSGPIDTSVRANLGPKIPIRTTKGRLYETPN